MIFVLRALVGLRCDGSYAHGASVIYKLPLTTFLCPFFVWFRFINVYDKMAVSDKRRRQVQEQVRDRGVSSDLLHARASPG